MHSKDKERLLKAQKRVRHLKLFYIHFAGYLVVVALLLYNLYIVEGAYKNNIISLNLSVLVLWTVAILLHAWKVFKENKVFKKSWEDKKMASYLAEEEIEETKMWE
ncbi:MULTISPECIES: 2TM domain-containing protein [Winogradskyella]|uniref:2TM domain-containing protein n=1 Tax=Winogradskyella marincola TaxID=3037795 RepID=A0ABT6G2U4_9FLAO|nr:2TM domain-containing protein [Winogradskyella sp. YYF002]MDG4716313.1 2TM domain-containing protein [Winogradskyella sp. YYF002]